jgi:glutamine amidotransferase
VSVAIVDYGSGNLHSAVKAFERAADGGHDIVLTSDPDVVRGAERVVLPGVGAFPDCRRGLESVAGMIEALDEVVLHRGRPFLGICVGMQLLASMGREHRDTPGLGWIPGEVVAIEPKDPGLKVPHMGWNTLSPVTRHPLLEGMKLGPDGLHAYFVHSYHLRPQVAEHLVAETEYGLPLAAVVGHDNIAGTQFHPEKSQTLGLALIANFLRWAP